MEFELELTESASLNKVGILTQTLIQTLTQTLTNI